MNFLFHNWKNIVFKWNKIVDKVVLLPINMLTNLNCFVDTSERFRPSPTITLDLGKLEKLIGQFDMVLITSSSGGVDRLEEFEISFN